MENLKHSGRWLAAGLLCAVLSAILATCSKTPPLARETTKETKRTDETKTTATTESPAVQPAAIPSTPPLVLVPSVPQPPRDPDDPIPAVKPITPADRENSLRVLDNIQFALRDYRSALGENPVGTNAEITSSLLGNNRKQAKVPLPEGANVNTTGEMLDLWGTPYFFHQQSATKMEIRSAGPDRKMWTPDDLGM